MVRRAGQVIVGFGDDAACLALPADSGQSLLFTTDLLIEGTHFTWQTATPATLGEKTVAVNVSDIAAMGGRPTAMVVGVGAPPDFPVARLEAIFRAIERACWRWGVALVGGDTVRSERLVLAPALIGEFDGPADRLPLRSRLRAGQYLYVTGTLGDSAAGLLLLLAGRNARERSLPQPYRRYLIRRHQRPQPRLAEGRLLAEQLDDPAMIDLSDDLRTSIGLLSRASRVGASIRLDRLPISPALRRLARLIGRDASEMAACGGEDYELLFATAAPPRAVRRLFRRAGIATPVRAIGCVGGKQVLWLDKGRKPVALSCRVFEHFAGDSHGT
jgi:thiamine-monophosphate kinase